MGFGIGFGMFNVMFYLIFGTVIVLFIVTAVKRESASLMDIKAGESVKHAAFGHGLVLSVRAMGGDALIEVAFDTVGTKKLMLKAAMRHLTKE